MSIKTFINKIRTLLPYFLLIAIYFFFVNIEARKENNINRFDEKETLLPDNKSKEDDKKLTITIPVIPYKE